MKIIFNTGQIYLHGGIEKTIAERANYFSNLPGVEVVILTTEQKGLPSCYALDERIELIDLFVNYNRHKSYFSIENLKKSIKHYFSQRKIISKLKPDVIISPNYNFDHYWLPFIKGKATLIKERHSSRYNLDTSNSSVIDRVKIKLNNIIEKKYNKIIVLNKDEKKYVKTNNAVIIPNSITIPELKTDLKNKRAIAAGRIAPVKDFSELIYIWKRVVEKNPDWKLDIYGDDYLDTKQKLQNLINQLNLNENIFLKDSVNNLTEVMQNYSLYLMTSITECFPMVLLESLSVGLPIISYDCPNGPRNIISHEKDGYLIENRNRELFVNTVNYLIDNIEIRKNMGIAAKHNSYKFSTSTIMKQWKKLLDINV